MADKQVIRGVSGPEGGFPTTVRDEGDGTFSSVVRTRPEYWDGAAWVGGSGAGVRSQIFGSGFQAQAAPLIPAVAGKYIVVDAVIVSYDGAPPAGSYCQFFDNGSGVAWLQFAMPAAGTYAPSLGPNGSRSTTLGGSAAIAVTTGGAGVTARVWAAYHYVTA